MKHLIFYIVVLSIVIGCTEELDIDYLGDSEGTLVVDGNLTTDTTAHTVYLHRAIDYRDTVLFPETDAIVTISDEDNRYSLTEIEPGKYQTDSSVYGEWNTWYTLHIELSNGTTYEGSDYLNSISVIDSIEIRKEKYLFMEDSMHLVYFYGQEDPTPNQYYRWDLYINDTLWSDTLKNVVFAEDANVNGNYIQDFDVYWLEDDAFKTDTAEVTLVMSSVSEEYYNFIEAVMMETEWRGGIFDPTPANVPTNIEGASGFFRASAVTRKSTTYIVPSGED